MADRACCECECGRTVAGVSTASFEVAECEYRPDERIPWHRHERAGFCLVIDGAYEERTVESTLRCEPAMLLFYPAGARHSNVISSRGSRCLSVEIAPAVMSSLGDRLPVVDELASGRHGAAHWFAYKLRTELRAGDALSPMVIDGVGLALLAEFVRRPGARLGAAAPPWLAQVHERLHDEFAVPPALEDLAHAAGVHRVHLSRAFREHFGCTVGEYVRQRRIEYACDRLLRTDAPLSEVALSAGFADQSHFTTTFRRLVGVTPRQFRARASLRP